MEHTGMWGHMETGSGYWNVFMWFVFFAIVSGFVLWFRSFGRMDYKRNTEQDEMFLSGWSGSEVPADGAKAAAPGSASYWGFNVALEPVYNVLKRFHNGSASDYAGYFVVTTALIGILLLF
ncbi:MAG: hydrogenase [Synergistaceae bacterium]|nr:hydrogenase [Synergistaceae bacterium]